MSRHFDLGEQIHHETKSGLWLATAVSAEGRGYDVRRGPIVECNTGRNRFVLSHCDNLGTRLCAGKKNLPDCAIRVAPNRCGPIRPLVVKSYILALPALRQGFPISAFRRNGLFLWNSSDQGAPRVVKPRYQTRQSNRVFFWFRCSHYL